MPLCLCELWRVGQLACPLPNRLTHVNGKTAEGRARALWPLRARATPFAGSDVDIGAVAITPTAVVELLTCGAAIAVAFRLISEPLRAVERAVFFVDAIAGSHVSSDAPIRQPLQELPVGLPSLRVIRRKNSPR
jgi:hypothetical protein